MIETFGPRVIGVHIGRNGDGYAPGRLGITEFNELPQGLYGSERASALAQVDARYDRNALAALRPMRARRPQARLAMLSTAWSRTDPFWTAWIIMSSLSRAASSATIQPSTVSPRIEVIAAW